MSAFTSAITRAVFSTASQPMSPRTDSAQPDHFARPLATILTVGPVGLTV
ncbi:hypothetical protein [Streptomyces adelaidensis]|nr:hypothetical protein [Streptomyces adelaidensis]